MSTQQDGSPAVERPRAWRYATGAALTLPLLFVLWLVFDFRVLHPELANGMETTMDKVRWVMIPLLATAFLFGGAYIRQAHRADAHEQGKLAAQRALDSADAAKKAEVARREYVLEVIGLGITVEKYRQGKLWQALQSGGADSSIRETDPKKIPWAITDKWGMTGGRAYDALENGADPSPMYWGVPSFCANGAILDPARQPSEISPLAGLVAGAETTGMAWHLWVVGPWRAAERPDDLLTQVFAFFDQHPDVSHVIVTAEDSLASRDSDRRPGTPSLVNDGHYILSMSDASAVFVLARRERVEPLRPYVWDDPDNHYLQHNLRQFYYDVMESVPTAAKLAQSEGSNLPRQPTVAEWLPAAAEFAKNPVHVAPNGSKLFAPVRRWVSGPPSGWKPTPWFPIPWNRDQMATFDRMPSLGFLHRPVFVKFEDEHGQPVTRRDARQKLLEAGWQQALQTLPDAVRAQGPARIIGAFDNKVEQRLIFEGMLHRYAEQGGPEIDTGNPAQFINTDRRMGDTGAATFFVQMGLGIMGSYIDGGASAAVNLRDPAGASIVFLTPPTAERRDKQGDDVFQHKVAPAIDPKNYEPPTVGDLQALDETTAAQAPAPKK